MSVALLRKEWREHRWMLLALVGLLGLFFGLALVRTAGHTQEQSHYEPVRVLALLLATMGAHVLTARLVTREYAARTQLFLETLPVTRARILTTKLLLGAGLIALVLATALGVSAFTAPPAEAASPRFLFVMGVRALTLCLQGYALLFVGGLLGRYRVSLLLFAVVLLFMVDQLTALDLGEVGPAALMRDDFGFERHRLPVRDVALGWAQISLCVAAAYALALPRDGTLTALMSERMSHREKVAITCVTLGAMVAIQMLEEAKDKPAYALLEAQRAEEGGASVAVLAGQGASEAQAAQLARTLAHELAQAQDYLALTTLPGVFVVPTREVGPDVFQRAKLEEADGVLVRANLAHAQLDTQALVAFVLREVLLWTSGGRLEKEERLWVLDGFSAGWTSREEAAAQRPLQLRALWGARMLPPSAPLLRRWLHTREQLGPCIAGGMAHGALAALTRAAGPERTRAFLRRALAPKQGLPAWAALTEPSLEQLLQEETGLDTDALLARWRESLQAAAHTHAAALGALPTLRPEAELVSSAEGAWELRHALTLEASAPARGYALVYAKLGPFDREVPAHELERQDVLAKGGTLPRTLARGERWLWAFEVRSEPLGCTLRTGAERRELP